MCCVPQVKYVDKIAPAQIKLVQIPACKTTSTQHLAFDIAKLEINLLSHALKMLTLVQW